MAACCPELLSTGGGQEAWEAAAAGGRAGAWGRRSTEVKRPQRGLRPAPQSPPLRVGDSTVNRSTSGAQGGYSHPSSDIPENGETHATHSPCLLLLRKPGSAPPHESPTPVLLLACRPLAIAAVRQVVPWLWKLLCTDSVSFCAVRTERPFGADERHRRGSAPPAISNTSQSAMMLLAFLLVSLDHISNNIIPGCVGRAVPDRGYLSGTAPGGSSPGGINTC
eukprot:363607-Chlamydomonas_euryale.AAC.5